MENILANIDLYGLDVLLEQLKKQFLFISFAENSIPTAGSRTLPTSKLVRFKDDCKLIKVIKHRNKDLTLQTNKGFYKFSN
jgi:hypothetical protein